MRDYLPLPGELRPVWAANLVAAPERRTRVLPSVLPGVRTSRHPDRKQFMTTTVQTTGIMVGLDQPVSTDAKFGASETTDNGALGCCSYRKTMSNELIHFHHGGVCRGEWNNVTEIRPDPHPFDFPHLANVGADEVFECVMLRR